MKSLVSYKLLIIIVAWIGLSSSLILAKAHFCKFKDHSLIVAHDDTKTTAINPATGQSYFIWFVNNESQSPGEGTFESPFPTLLQAQQNAHPSDIIYVFPGNKTAQGMDAGITLQQGQQLLGAGICQHIITTQGRITIPAQACDLPLLTNTAVLSLATYPVVLLNAGDNIVSGLNLFDALGGAFDAGNHISAGIRVDGGLNYLIKHNIISTGTNFTLPTPGGNGIAFFGGGNVIVKRNTVIGRDLGPTAGIEIFAANAPLQGTFKIKKNLWTGADAHSGLDIAIAIFPDPNIIGNLTMCIVDNTCNSQANGSPFSFLPGGIILDTFGPNAASTVTLDIKRNTIIIPAGFINPAAFAGIGIIANGPGKIIAKLNKNVSLTIPPTPGYFFSGTPADLQVCFNSNNVGTRVGP